MNIKIDICHSYINKLSVGYLLHSKPDYQYPDLSKWKGAKIDVRVYWCLQGSKRTAETDKKYKEQLNIVANYFHENGFLF